MSTLDQRPGLKGKAQKGEANSAARSLAGRMHALFRGLDRAYVRLVVGNKKREGQPKLQGKYTTIRGALSPALFARHLSGSLSLGSIPVTDDGLCWFGVIDIDQYDLDPASLEAAIDRLGLPLVLVRSKSGGYHLLLFFRERAPAGLVQATLREWAVALGHPRAEIFPKQTKLAPGATGSCINLPYFGGNGSSRHALRNGHPLTVEEFLDLAEGLAITAAQLKVLRPQPTDDHEDLLSGGPPCLQQLAVERCTEGARNKALFNYAVLAKMKFGDDFLDRLHEYNQRVLDPPLSDKEVAQVAKSVGKKPYRYTCKDEPICALCDRATCLEREFGVAGGPQSEQKEPKKGSAFKVLEQVLDEAEGELWHTADRRPLVSLTIGGHREHLPVTSDLFEQFLVHGYYAEKAKPLPIEPLRAAVRVFAAQANLEGPQHEVAVRLAEYDSAIYIDLANPNHQAVRIDASGWTVITRPPVRFVRTPNMLPLPVPERGGTIEALRSFVTIRDPQDWTLFVGYLLACLRPRGPYPQLHIHGTHGSAKSTLARMTVALIDPGRPDIRALTTSERDLAIAAQDAHLLAFDNVSGLTPEFSDALCRLSSGAGLSTRKLYTDDKQQVFHVARPIVLNGITDIATRSDLRDRALIIDLPIIEDTHRKDEATLWRDFDAVRPLILGVLYNAVSCALRWWDATTLLAAPRMADAARWITAAEPALGWGNGAFLAAYAAHRDESAKWAVEYDMLASAVVELVAEHNFRLTPTDLFKALTHIVDPESPSQIVARLPSWPKNPRQLSSQLKRLIPDLAKYGVQVKFGRGDSRWIFVGKESRGGEPKTTYTDTW